MIEKKIWLERTDGFRYINFQPPLTPEEYAYLPLPKSAYGDGLVEPIDITTNGNARVRSLGFTIESVESGFTSYALRVERFLGNRALDSQIHQTDSPELFAILSN